jgi:hypothetical protein
MQNSVRPPWIMWFTPLASLELLHSYSFCNSILSHTYASLPANLLSIGIVFCSLSVSVFENFELLAPYIAIRMDFSVDSLHTIEKDLDSEIVKLPRWVPYSTVQLLLQGCSRFTWWNVNKGDGNAKSVDWKAKRDITAVKNTVKTEIKSRAAVVKKNVTQDR